jgi:hypothetical protein
MSPERTGSKPFRVQRPPRPLLPFPEGEAFRGDIPGAGIGRGAADRKVGGKLPRLVPACALPRRGNPPTPNGPGLQ